MRRTVAPACLLLLLATALAGCSGGGEGAAGDATADDFSDLGLEATADTGLLLGVVVDQAIRPVEGASIAITKPDGGELSATTDAQGRFAFADLAPGSYVIRASHAQYTSAQATAEVVAGVEDPPTVRILLDRLFAQDPFSELIKFDGFLQCAYAIGVSSTCVNDYTRILTVCPGGCLRDYNLSSTAGNVREYVTPVGPGWQVLVFEAVWEPTVVGTSEELGVTVSYFGRIGASHSFDGASSPSPMHFAIEVEDEAKVDDAGVPENIPPEGIPDLFVFFSAGSGSVTVNQPFQAFQTNFYYGIPPEGWSFVNGDQPPF